MSSSSRTKFFHCVCAFAFLIKLASLRPQNKTKIKNNNNKKKKYISFWNRASYRESNEDNLQFN